MQTWQKYLHHFITGWKWHSGSTSHGKMHFGSNENFQFQLIQISNLAVHNHSLSYFLLNLCLLYLSLKVICTSVNLHSSSCIVEVFLLPKYLWKRNWIWYCQLVLLLAEPTGSKDTQVQTLGFSFSFFSVRNFKYLVGFSCCFVSVKVHHIYFLSGQLFYLGLHFPPFQLNTCNQCHQLFMNWAFIIFCHLKPLPGALCFFLVNCKKMNG